MVGPVNETTRTAQWLYATLAADAPLQGLLGGASDPRIYEDEIDQGAGYPAIVFQDLAPNDVTTHNVTRIMTNDLWIVKGVAEAQSYLGALSAVADRIEAVLHRSAGGVAGPDGVVFTSVRIRAVRYPETTEAGNHFRHLGGQYRIFTQVP